MENQSNDMQKKIFSSEFKKFCRHNFYSKMQELEKKRKYYIAAIILTVIVFLSAGSFVIYTGNGDEDVTKFGMFLLAMVFVLPPFISKMYKKRAKQLVLEKLLSFVGSFKINSGNSNISYVKSLKLFDNFNRHSIDDRIKGKYLSLDVDITEMKLSYVSGYGKNRSERTIFNGIFIVVPCHKKYEGITLIKRQAFLNFGNFGLQKVKLEDPEFEKIFDVYGTDQIESRYLITTAFMNRMVQLAKKSQMITLSFEHGNVNLAVSSAKDWFEIPLLKPATEISHYRAILIELITILKIIDSLKLDQNIGM